MRPNGTLDRLLSPCGTEPGFYAPAWSPDGRYVASVSMWPWGQAVCRVEFVDTQAAPSARPQLDLGAKLCAGWVAWPKTTLTIPSRTP